MKSKAKFKSDAFEVIHSTAQWLHRAVRRVTAWPVLVLVTLVVLGIVFQVLDLAGWHAMLEWARGQHAGWRLAVAIVAVQVILYTFAQPGSLLLWVAAVLYAPPLATLILTVGGTAGALGAYLFAYRLTRVTVAQASERRLYRMLEAKGDFFTLCALRIFPGVPHSLINYTAGILRLPLLSFLVATAIGHAVKSFLYSSAISKAIESAAFSDLLRMEILAPLFVIALLLIAGHFIRKHWPGLRD